MSQSRSLRAASVRALVSLALVTLAAACGPKAPPQPSDPVPPHAADIDETPPVAAPEPTTWLAWRQDAGGMAATALIVDRGLGGPVETLEVNRALFVLAASDVWSLSPLAERWALAPCGEPSGGIARGLRFRALGVGDERDLPGDAEEYRWSTEERRPGVGESAMYDEVLVFSAQVGDHVVLRHITRDDTCPVPAGSLDVEVLAALDLRRGVVVSTLELLPDATRRELADRWRSEAARKVAETREDLAAASIADKLRLDALDVRDTPRGRVVHLVFVGEDAIFAQLDDPSGMAPQTVRARVPLTSLPLELTALAPPPTVKAFWEARETLDAGRTEGVPDAQLYGAVGWVELPSRLHSGVRAELIAIRDAPTPDGPTDWD